MRASCRPTLVRVIGRWSLVALTLNCIIGSGVFGLPSVIAKSLGDRSPWAWLMAAAGTAFVMACFAEVASRFDRSGGVYLYCRAAFGRTAGIAVAWFGWLARLTAAAANANLFVIYLGEFWPAVRTSGPRVLVITALLGFLTLVNYVGVRQGTLQSNLFTAAKLATLAAFLVAGLVYLGRNHLGLAVSAPAGPPSQWLHPILLLMFAYGGYETALMPGGEAIRPRRDYPFALFTALVILTVLYTMTQWITISLLPAGAMSDRPLASAAERMVGPWGAGFISVGVILSCFGYLSANLLGFPRILFALAENRDMPAWLGRVHPRFRTPYAAILVFAAFLYAFSLAGSFEWNLVISAISRLVYYGSVCAALPVLRRKPGIAPAEFHLPGGDLIAGVAVLISLALFPRLNATSMAVMGVLAVLIALNSWWATRKPFLATLGG
jgi:amino acid transporter